MQKKNNSEKAIGSNQAILEQSTLTFWHALINLSRQFVQRLTYWALLQYHMITTTCFCSKNDSSTFHRFLQLLYQRWIFGVNI